MKTDITIDVVIDDREISSMLCNVWRWLFRKYEQSKRKTFLLANQQNWQLQGPQTLSV